MLPLLPVLFFAAANGELNLILWVLMLMKTNLKKKRSSKIKWYIFISLTDVELKS